MRLECIAARCAAVAAAAWAGVIVAIGAIAAPSAFAVLGRADAGRLAARLFTQEAYLGIAVAVALVLVERRRAAASPPGPVFGATLLLAFGALFCTVAGHFALQPMMDAARAGHGVLSFGALHAVAGAFFVAKGVLVLALAWRLAPIRPAATSS